MWWGEEDVKERFSEEWRMSIGGLLLKGGRHDFGLMRRSRVWTDKGKLWTWEKRRRWLAFYCL